MKITVLGAGSAGCLTALHYSYYAFSDQLPNLEVELVHDPNIPPTPVGLATLLETPKVLWNAFGLDWYNNPIDAVPKLGILYEGWGTEQDEFFHPFPFESTAMHFSPSKLQTFILESGLFKVVEGNAGDYNEIDSDFIFDCRGTPTDWDDYDFLENPLNSVLISEIDVENSGQMWTRAVATPDGWTFVIPQFKDSMSIGYLYNDTVSSDSDAIDNFNDMFNVDDIKKIKFRNYIAKNPIIDNRIVLNGNRLFFIEPLEAATLNIHLHWCRNTWDWIVTKKFDSDTIKKEINQNIQRVKNFINWHYQFGSKYDTPFWNHAKNFTPDDEDFNTILRSNLDFEGWYGQWESWNFKNWYNGVKGTNLRIYK